MEMVLKQNWNKSAVKAVVCAMQHGGQFEMKMAAKQIRDTGI